MPSSLASPLAPNGFFALANLVGRSDQNLSALVPEMYICCPWKPAQADKASQAPPGQFPVGASQCPFPTSVRDFQV